MFTRTFCNRAELIVPECLSYNVLFFFNFPVIPVHMASDQNDRKKNEMKDTHPVSETYRTTLHLYLYRGLEFH